MGEPALPSGSMMFKLFGDSSLGGLKFLLHSHNVQGNKLSTFVTCKLGQLSQSSRIPLLPLEQGQ